MTKAIDRTGEVYRDLKITEEISGGKVKVKCLKCGFLDTVSKHYLIYGKKGCTGCGKHGSVKDKLGQTFNNLKIIEDNGKQVVMCACTNCGAHDEYVKQPVVEQRIYCRHCHTEHNDYAGKGPRSNGLEDSFKINRVEFELMAERYYRCKCRKCNKLMILSTNEMKKHKC